MEASQVLERVFLVILKVILKQTRKKVFYLFLGKSDHFVSRTGLVSRLTMPRFLAEAFKYLFSADASCPYGWLAGGGGVVIFVAVAQEASLLLHPTGCTPGLSCKLN